MREPERKFYDDAFYFGCIGRPGHFLHSTRGYQVWRDTIPADFPISEERIDSAYTPRIKGQTQGVASLWHGNGWTILAFWDRSVDGRGGCNSNFILRGTLTFDEAVTRAKERFPFVWNRFTFPVVEYKPETAL